MSQGQEGDTRNQRSERNSDFSESKAAFQQKKNRTPNCAVCKQKIVGATFTFGEGKFTCFRCHNEPL